jgi:hypothetical protein
MRGAGVRAGYHTRGSNSSAASHRIISRIPGQAPLHKRSLRRSRLSGTGGKRGNQSPASCPEDPEEIRLGSV